MFRRFRSLRSRTGIRAPKMAVRTHLPWYVRLLAMVGVMAISLPTAFWIYDAGRKVAGFDQAESGEEISRLTVQLDLLRDELTSLRNIAATADSALGMERGEKQRLARQVIELEQENARLKEDLAFFESLVPNGIGGEGLTVQRFQLQPTGVSGEMAFMALLVNGGGKGKIFEGEVEIRLSSHTDGNGAIVVSPAGTTQSKGRIPVRIKHFQRLEGTFLLPETMDKPQVAEVRVLVGDRVEGSRLLRLKAGGE